MTYQQPHDAPPNLPMNRKLDSVSPERAKLKVFVIKPQFYTWQFCE